MERSDLRLVGGTEFQPPPKPVEFQPFHNGVPIPVIIAEARLNDTPDRRERLAWARTLVVAAGRDLLSVERQRERGKEWLATYRDESAERRIATAFVMLGHLLGIRHPEKLFDEREGRAAP